MLIIWLGKPYIKLALVPESERIQMPSNGDNDADDTTDNEDNNIPVESDAPAEVDNIDDASNAEVKESSDCDDPVTEPEADKQIAEEMETGHEHWIRGTDLFK